MGPKADDVDRLETEEMMEEDTVAATREQIEQTRGEMSGTIDAIRDKLNPQTLAEQAKETVTGIASDVMDKAKATVHDVVQEAKETLPTLGANVAHQAVSGAVSEAKEAVGSAVSTVRHAAGEAAGTAKEAGVTVMDMIRQNPLPAALIGIGVGWLWASQRGHRMAEQRHDRWRSGYSTPYDEGTWHSEGARMADESHASSRLSGAMNSARETVSHVQDGVGRAAGQVQERVSDLAGRVQGSVSDAAERVSDKVGAVGRQAGSYGREWAASCQAMLEERPLAVGAMALGLGAAVGMLVPGTYRENRMMGEARDQLVEKVQDKAQDLAMRAQIVAEEAIDTATVEAENQGLKSSS